MDFDKTFKGLSKPVQIILLIIPFVGAVVEILYRLSAFLRKKTTINLVGLILFCVLGMIWIGLLLDVIFLLTNNRLFMVEE